MTEPTRLPKPLRRLNAANRAALPPYDRQPITTADGLAVVGWSWPPAPVADVRRCWCGRPIAADSMSTCGCCCTEHDQPATPPRLPEHLRTDDINDYLRQKGEL